MSPNAPLVHKTHLTDAEFEVRLMELVSNLGNIDDEATFEVAANAVD
jgi:hypothetical protein